LLSGASGSLSFPPGAPGRPPEVFLTRFCCKHQCMALRRVGRPTPAKHHLLRDRESYN